MKYCMSRKIAARRSPASSGRFVIFAVSSAITLSVLAGCGQKTTQADAQKAKKETAAKAAPPVVTQSVKVGDVSQTVLVTGSLVALQDVSLSAKQGGRLAKVLVRQGEPVSAGQVLARIDATDLEAQVRSNEASVASAQAKLAQAEAAYGQQLKTTETAITSARATYQQQVATSSAQVRSAEAALASARASQSTVREGARPEERTQTQAILTSAQANLKKAESDLSRYEKLHAAGAVSDAEIDQYHNARDVAQANLNSARAAVELQQKGSRRQEVEQSTQQVRQAEEALRQARAAQATNAVRKADLDTALAQRAQNAVKRADVRAARASVQEARNALTIARQAVADTVVRAPIAGRISARSGEPGQIVKSDTVLLHVIALDSVYFEPSVPNTALGSVKVGQQVMVQVDTYPGRKLQGTVSRIYPEGSSTTRSFPIRVTLPNSNGALRPQMFAQGQITTSAHRNVVLAPREALVTDAASGKNVVFTVENGVAHKRGITPGYPSPDGGWVEVSGLSRDAQVITMGQRSLKDGQNVSASAASKPATTQAASL